MSAPVADRVVTPVKIVVPAALVTFQPAAVPEAEAATDNGVLARVATPADALPYAVVAHKIVAKTVPAPCAVSVITILPGGLPTSIKSTIASQAAF